MASIVHGFDWPDRFVTGTVGEPGERTFYLQARQGSQIISVALEKEQTAVLAEKIDEILDQLMRHDGNPFSIPEEAATELIDRDPMDVPIEEQFRVGALSLGWDPTTAQIVIEAFAPVDDDPETIPTAEDIESAEVLLVRLPVGSARAFAERTAAVVKAGRPRCPDCGQPLESPDHVCENPLDDR